MVSDQFKQFAIGSAVFAAMAVVLSIVFAIYAGATTQDKSMKSAN